MKDIQRLLSEAVSLLPAGTQQQIRDEIREGRLSPQLAAALLAKLETALSESRYKPEDGPMSAKLDSISTAIRNLEQRAKESMETRGAEGAERSAKLVMERIEWLRGDMRKLEDGLASLEPYQHWKVLTLMGLGLVVGAMAGWYGHSGYETIGGSHHYIEVNRE